jgi:hypothetical protein
VFLLLYSTLLAGIRLPKLGAKTRANTLHLRGASERNLLSKSPTVFKIARSPNPKKLPLPVRLDDSDFPLGHDHRFDGVRSPLRPNASGANAIPNTSCGVGGTLLRSSDTADAATLVLSRKETPRPRSRPLQWLSRTALRGLMPRGESCVPSFFGA